MKQMSRGERELFWQEQVKEWTASGKSAAEFAQGTGYSEKTLRFWKRQFRQVEELKGRLMGVEQTGDCGFVRVVPRKEGGQSLTIEVERVLVHVTSGFDPRLLIEVVSVLRGGEA